MVGAYNRDVSIRKAKRKKRIAEQYHYWLWPSGWFDNLHQYSKNQVYCSCPMCHVHTNNKGKNRRKHGNYFPSKYWKHSDLKKIQSMESQLFDYETGA
jgi:hypothetical protein